jgi:hypothetical protein
MPPIMHRACGGTVRFVEVLATKLAVEDDELVDRFVIEVGRPICKEDQSLLNAIMRIWRERDPKKVRKEDFVDASSFADLDTFYRYLRVHPEMLRNNPEYIKAWRDRDIRMCEWFDKCFPGHDRWEILKLSRPTKRRRLKVRQK